MWPSRSRDQAVGDCSGYVRLADLGAGARGHVVGVVGENDERADRLGALGVTPGASVEVLQRFPAFVFRCDQTELAVEPAVAAAVLVELES